MYKIFGAGALVIIIGASAFFIGKNYGAVTPEYPVGQTPTNTHMPQVERNNSIGKNSKPAPVKTTGDLSVSVTTGKAPLTVTFSIKGSAGGQFIDFGDGSNPCSPMTSGFVFSEDGCEAPAYPATFTHTYITPGTYKVTASRHLPASTLGTATITVTSDSTSVSPSATIDQSSLNANTGVLTGTATGLSQVFIDLLTYTPAKSACWTQLHAPVAVPVVNNMWTYSLGADAGVAAGTQVVILDSNAAGVVPHTLASGIYKSASAPAQNCTPGA